jgi:hypothetical protein
VTEINPPGFLQNAGNIHTAEVTRAPFNGLVAGSLSSGSLKARGGVAQGLGGALAVTQNGTPNMSVNVASGQIFIPGTEGPTQGTYSCINDATKNVTIAAADPTNPRIDLIVAKVQDSFYSGGTNTFSIVAVTGTPAGSPTPPAAPANSLTLAQISVVANDTSITTGEITDKRFFMSAAGGIIVCTSTTRPASGTVASGQHIQETDTGFEMWTSDGGATWKNVTGMFKIAENILGSAASSVTFSAIPGSYRSLMLQAVARGDTAAGFTTGNIRFNSDTAGNYDNEQVGGVGSTISAFETLNGTSVQIGEVSAASAVAGSATIWTVQIPWYAGTTFWKFITVSHMLNAQTSGGQSGSIYSKHWAGRWRSTAAITSINIFPSAGNFITGSSFVLYGLL